MARRASKKRSDRRGRFAGLSAQRLRAVWLGRLALPALAAIILAAWWLWGDETRRRLGLETNNHLATRGNAILRVASWNLRNFPEPDENLELLQARLREVDAQVWAFQEVSSPAALESFLREALPDYETASSEQGGAGRQHLVLAWDPHSLRAIGTPREHRELTMGGRVRPGLSLHLRALGSELDFQVMAVHLKAMPDGYDLRREQSSILLTVSRELLANDPQLVVMGDFNVTGAPGEAASDEAARLIDELDDALNPLSHEQPCTAYWDGARRDAWKEPSTLDWIFVAGLEPWLGDAPVAHVAGQCASHRCQPLRSTDAYPEPDLVGISDHCPIYLDLDVSASPAPTPSAP